MQSRTTRSTWLLYVLCPLWSPERPSLQAHPFAFLMTLTFWSASLTSFGNILYNFSVSSLDQCIVQMSQCFINYLTRTAISHCFSDFFPLAFFFYSIKSYNLKQHAFSIACRFDNISNCWVKIPYFLSFLYMCVCVCARAQLLSCVQLFATPWI